MTQTASTLTGSRYLLAGLLLIFPLLSFAQPGIVESDPKVVRILPNTYPLNRVRVAASKYPWSAIGLVTVLGGRYSCTGTLASDQYVLTAAHCVYLARKHPQEIHFLAGYEQDRYVGHARAKSVYINRTFRYQRPSLKVFAHDWALLELEKPIGKQAGHLSWAAVSPARLKQLGNKADGFKVAGYRRDRRFVQTVDHRCRISGFTKGNRLIIHQCPLIGGDSGGPILMPYGNRLLVVGIDVGAERPKGLYLQRGEVRDGYAVPSSAFQAKLNSLGIRAARTTP